MKSRIIINSRNRATQSDSPTDFKMKFLYPIETGDYTLKYAYFPNTLYNVNNNNNYFKVNNTNVSITNGSYVTQELLVTAINASLSTLNTSNPSISLTTSLQGNFLKITNNNPSDTITLDFTENNFCYLIGLSKQVYIFTTDIVSTGMINLSPEMAINIIINQQGNIRDNNSLSYTFRIPLIADKNEYICYEPAESFQQVVEFSNDQSLLSIRVVDDNFQTLDTLGVDWWILLEKQLIEC